MFMSYTQGLYMLPGATDVQRKFSVKVQTIKRQEYRCVSRAIYSAHLPTYPFIIPMDRVAVS